MIKREFTALIIDDFKTHWIGETAKNENITIEQAIAYYDGPELDALHDRLTGQRVTLVEHEYKEGENDFFEKEGNNFVIYRKLFAKI